MLFANTVAELVNVSPSGALIRLGFKPRLGGEWPLAIALPARGQIWLNGRVVRCELDSVKTGASARGTEYLLGLAFVQPSEQAQALLDQLCGGSTVRMPITDAPRRRRLSKPHRLRRLALTLRRTCPECRSTTVTKQTGHRYSCDQCGSDFAGFHLGLLRISL
jgi:hypothetical protein